MRPSFKHTANALCLALLLATPAAGESISTSFSTTDGFVTGAVTPTDLSDGDFVVTFSGGQRQASLDPAAYNDGPDAWMVINGDFVGGFGSASGSQDLGTIEFSTGATEVSFFAGTFGFGNPVIRAFGLDGTTELASVTITQTDISAATNPVLTVFRSSDLGGALIGAIEIDNAGPAASPPYVTAIDSFHALSADHITTSFDNQAFVTGSTSSQALSDGAFSAAFEGGQQQQSIHAAAYNEGPDAWMVINGMFNGGFGSATGAEDQGTIQFDPPAAEVSFVAGNFGFGNPEIRVLAPDGSTVLATETVTQNDITAAANPQQSLFRAIELGQPIGSVVFDNAGPAANPPYVVAIDSFTAIAVPEPSQLLLALSALGTLVLRGRRRRDRTSALQAGAGAVTPRTMASTPRRRPGSPGGLA